MDHVMDFAKYLVVPWETGDGLLLLEGGKTGSLCNYYKEKSRWMMYSHALEEFASVVVGQHVNEEKLSSFVAKSRHGKWAVELGTSPS